MIARFFSTSKPIHSVLVAVFTLAVFFTVRAEQVFGQFSFTTFLNEFLKYFIILGSVFVLDFLVHRNKLTQKNGYEILIFSLLMATFPSTMLEFPIYISNFFIILALRRIISLRSNLRVKKKLFDAAFWICIAALFNFWCILFLILILFALILFAQTNLKNWIIPITAVITVFALIMSYGIITENTFVDLSEYYQPMNFDFSSYNELATLIPLVTIMVIGLWTLGYYVVNLNNKQKSFRASFILILIAFFIALAIILLNPEKNTSELIFILPALTIIITNYLESIKNKWLIEGFVGVLLILPLLSLVL